MNSRKRKTSNYPSKSSKNPKDPYSSKYKNAITSRKTKTNYVAPIVRQLNSKTPIKDYNAANIPTQTYTAGFGHQGTYSNFITGMMYAHMAGDDKAQCLSIVNQGNTVDNRIGHRIICKSLNLYVNVALAMHARNDEDLNWGYDGYNNANPPVLQRHDVNVRQEARLLNTARIVVFVDVATSANVPTLRDLFLVGVPQGGPVGPNPNPFTAYNIASQLVPTSTSRFKIICNEILEVDASIGCKTFHKYIPLEGLAITYLNSTSSPTDISTNGLWMFVLSSTQQGNPAAAETRDSAITFSFNARLRFVP